MGTCHPGHSCGLYVLPRTVRPDGSYGSLYNDLLTYVISAAL